MTVLASSLVQMPLAAPRRMSASIMTACNSTSSWTLTTLASSSSGSRDVCFRDDSGFVPWVILFVLQKYLGYVIVRFCALHDLPAIGSDYTKRVLIRILALRLAEVPTLSPGGRGKYS